MNEFEQEVAKEIAKQVPIKDIYEDTAKPSFKSTGEIVGLIPRAINAALEPVHKWVLQKEYNISETKVLLEQKLAKIPAEMIVPPEPYVAVPALQAISYSMDNEEIRNMYANLLSSSMISTIKNNVHPAYVEIIKQLSPDEAKILKYLFLEKTVPIIFLKRQQSNGNGEVTIIRNFSILDTKVNLEMPNKAPELLENLNRLKLIDIDDDKYIADNNYYEPLENHPYIINTKEKNILPDGHSWKVQKGIIQITMFGTSFCNICINGI